MPKLSLKDSDRLHRIAMRYDASLNADRSVDARKNLTPKIERVTYLKVSKSLGDGQYTRESNHLVESKLVMYKYLPNQVFRQYHNGTEIPVLEKIDNHWFPCDGVVINDSEFQRMRSFPGACGMDVDGLMKRCKKRNISSASKTTNVSGKAYYCTPNATYDQVEQNILDADIHCHNAKRKKALLADVQIANIKRKK